MKTKRMIFQVVGVAAAATVMGGVVGPIGTAAAAQAPSPAAAVARAHDVGEPSQEVPNTKDLRVNIRNMSHESGTPKDLIVYRDDYAAEYKHWVTIRPGEYGEINRTTTTRLQLYFGADALAKQQFTQINAYNDFFLYPRVEINSEMHDFNENEWWRKSHSPGPEKWVDYLVKRHIDTEFKEFAIEAAPRY